MSEMKPTVRLEHAVFELSPHAFTHLQPDDVAAEAWQRIADLLARVLRPAVEGSGTG